MANKFRNVKERIVYFVEIQNLKKEKYFREIGMTSSSFRGNALNTPLNSDAIVNILTKNPELNPNWLLTGKGDMLIPETGSNQNIVIKENSGEFNSVGKAGEANIKSKNNDAIGIGAINDKDEEIKRLREKVAYLQGQVDLLKGMIGE